MSTRNITMTVCSIVAHQLDATPIGLTPGSVLINGVVTITATGDGHTHAWAHQPGERMYWPGDTVLVRLDTAGAKL